MLPVSFCLNYSVAPGSGAALGQDLLTPRVEKLATHTDSSTAEGVFLVGGGQHAHKVMSAHSCLDNVG